jgi:hypothetical protein
MKLIQSQYRGYCKDQDEVKFTLAVMDKLFAEWDYPLIEKALIRFMQNDSKGFPPVPGQLITLAAEIRREEWDKRQREIAQLPEPETERIQMPDDIREKMKSLFKMPI